MITVLDLSIDQSEDAICLLSIKGIYIIATVTCTGAFGNHVKIYIRTPIKGTEAYTFLLNTYGKKLSKQINF